MIVKNLSVFLPRLCRCIPTVTILPQQVTFQWLPSSRPIGIKGSKHGVLSVPTHVSMPCCFQQGQDYDDISFRLMHPWRQVARL
jgi:hypothetical protein